MYIYFDRNGTIKEVINDESIRRGSSDYNKIYCYLEGNPDIDDIWYLQKKPDGTLTNEVSFVDNIVTKVIPYDAKRDMKYFQDFEEYQFYVFTLSSSYLSQNGLVVATIRVAENNTLWALGELTFNVQANIVNSDNDITKSQYDYLLLAYASRTLNEQTGSDLDNLLNEKIEAKANDIIEPIFNDYKATIDEEVENQNETIASLGQLQPSGVDTTTNILAKTSADGIWISTTNGHWYYWNGTQYIDGGVYQAVEISDGSVTKTKINSDVFTPDGIKMNGVTFISPTNSVSMILYFERTGALTITVKGTNLASRNPRLKIGYNSTNTDTDPNLVKNEIISGEFEKTYTISHNSPYTCIIFEISVGSYTTIDELLNISNPLITINNQVMSSYSNIVFKNYTPNNYLYLVTGLPNITDSEYLENYVNNFYNLNTLPYLEKHNKISVSNAQELVNAINSIATNVSNNIATKNNRYDIYLNSGTYELYDVIDKSNLQDQVLYHRGLEIPDYVNLYGIGSVTLKLTLPDTERASYVQILSTINTYGENYFENLNIEVTNGRYCVHDDDGGDYKNRTISFKNCTFKHNGNIIGYWESQECYGAGYTGGRKGIFTNCKFESVNFFPLYMHTSSSWYMTDKCYLELNNCVLLGANNEYSMDIHDAYGTTNTAIVNINNCYLQNKLKIRGTNPLLVYGGGNNNFNIDNLTTTPSKIYIVGNSNSDFTS